ncbi:homing endonuclease [Jimgerdemannia flammicorona]|uniref:Homing endonuclease n=1 Tax=Jimgerdemannia flammicorona TaxID=994334 RepID=A0A433QXH6_9FUNG|nr:homing endonuclease [Jimgerdemannia flammicorona]
MHDLDSASLWRIFCILGILSHYCKSLPWSRIRNSHGTQTFTLEFFTRSLPCFTELYTLFYPNGVKTVPLEIFDLLTPVALAHWICCDGSVQRHGLILCTDSFTIQEVVLLMNVLMVRYSLDCTLREPRQGQYHIKLLYMIRAFFNCGYVYNSGDKKDSYNFEVKNITDLQATIVPFFEQNQLLTKKSLDFTAFRTVVEMRAAPSGRCSKTMFNS